MPAGRINGTESHHQGAARRVTNFPLTALEPSCAAVDLARRPHHRRSDIASPPPPPPPTSGCSSSTASRSSGARRGSGSGAEVSYGFADGRRSFPDAINCRELAPMAELAPAWRATRRGSPRSRPRRSGMWSARRRSRFRAGAARRAARHPDRRPGRAPRASPSPTSGTDRARADDGVAPLTRATICLNPTLAWVDRTPRGRGQARSRHGARARDRPRASASTIPGPTGALMGYRDQGDIDALMPGDIAGAVALYGPARR